MNNRIILLRKTLHINQTDFAKKIGITQSGISNIELNITPLTERNIISICNIFNVNEQWLRFGTGDMFIKKDKQFEEFFEVYQHLSKPCQDFLYNTATELLKLQNKLSE